MPLFEYRCALLHTQEHYYPLAAQAPPVRPCDVPICSAVAVRRFPLVNCLQYFSEANGRVIENLDKTRTLHSHAQHRQLMKEKGVEPATDWHVSMRPSRM
jgi:hypothetical protein